MYTVDKKISIDNVGYVIYLGHFLVAILETNSLHSKAHLCESRV